MYYLHIVKINMNSFYSLKLKAVICNLSKEKCALQMCLNVMVLHFTNLRPLIGCLMTHVPQQSGLIGRPALWAVALDSELEPGASLTEWVARNAHTWIR